MMPSKSMPQKQNHDFTKRYPDIKASTYEPMHIWDCYQAFDDKITIYIRERIHSHDG